MTVEEISKILNETIVPNLLGEEITIAVDLSNIVDLGTAIADVDAKDLEDYAGQFVVGVARNWFDERRFERVDYGLMTDSREYGGVVQRVKAKLLTTDNSPIWTLKNGEDYFDGKYYGIDIDNRIYTKDTIFKINNSIPTEMFKQSFMSQDGVRELISLIETTVDNTLTFNLNGLAKTVYQQIIANTSEAQQIPLVTLYNSFAHTDLNAQTALGNPGFLRWAAQQIIRLRNLMTDYSSKYNDGTIDTFTPREDLRVTMLSEFATALTFNMEADTFHNDLVSVGQYNTINFWQNSTTDVLPNLGETAEIATISGYVEDVPTEVNINNIVTVIHDKYAGGYTARIDKITAQYIAPGDYTTYFHHVGTSRFVDTRNNAVVLTLN